MNKTQQRQQAKGEAFNAMMRIYHPKAKLWYSAYEGSYADQRDRMMDEIVSKYLRKLDEINRKP